MPDPTESKASAPDTTTATATDTAAAAATPVKAPRDNGNPLIEIAITIVLPALILMKLSSETRLGTMNALLLALAFPLVWGLREAIGKRKLSWMSVLGVVSTLLTGGIGLLSLDAKWLAVKEAAVPGLIGLVILGSTWTQTPLIRLLVFNAKLFDVDRVNQALTARQNIAAFEQRLRSGTVLLAGTFFFSAVANYFLARYVVTSPAGTAAFNEELGRLTLPSMAMMMGLMFWLAQGAKKLTGLDLGDMLQGA
jgi:intracellular septation protein A